MNRPPIICRRRARRCAFRIKKAAAPRDFPSSSTRRAIVQATDRTAARNRANAMAAAPIAPGVRIGHVHLKVADIDRALAFYCGVLGFELTQKVGPPGAA